MASVSEPPKILILGGGFGGVAAARKLEHLLRPDEATITIVSRENFSLFTPMLPEVSSGNLEARHVATPLRAQLRRGHFILADVRTLDLVEKTVVVEHTLLGTEQTLSYDQLVIGVGAVTSTFNLPGVAEHALPLKTLEDADRLRNHVIAMLELADVAQDPLERERLLRFVFVGGGFTGVEAAGEMVDFFRSIVKFYRSIAPAEIDVVLVEGGAKLLPDLQAGMGEYSARELERRGVKVRLNALVAGADERGLKLRDGRRFDAGTIVWSAGVRPSPFVAGLSIGNGRGGSIVTNPDMSVPGYPGVWAIGDCASIPNPHGGTYAATAQYAIREGPLLAANIVATLRGKPTKPFRYEAIGIMASLGARHAVAGIRGKYLLTGFPAWLLWRTYYLARLPGLDRRFRVALDWTLGLIFPRDIAELRVYTKAAQLRSALEAGIRIVPAPENNLDP
jgi:NADH:ubiquinone reductase (H+-translocating)